MERKLFKEFSPYSEILKYIRRESKMKSVIPEYLHRYQNNEPTLCKDERVWRYEFTRREEKNER